MKQLILALIALLSLTGCEEDSRSVAINNELFTGYYYKASGETKFYLVAACHAPLGTTIPDYCGVYVETARLNANGCAINWDTGVEYTPVCKTLRRWGPGEADGLGPKIPRSAFPEAIYPPSLWP